jgi:pSer/pThr/pTyr-binding forkhead associated (FHA) protein
VPALVVTDGPLAGRRFEVEGELVMGRENAPITIDDPEVSRRHAILRVVEERVVIEDLSSLNGTFVNGRRIAAPTTLSAGDKVMVGMTSFEVEAAARSTATVVSQRPAAAATAVASSAVQRPAARAERREAPIEPFGHFAARAGSRKRIASRRLTPQLFTTACIVGTAVALVVYFSMHG